MCNKVCNFQHLKYLNILQTLILLFFCLGLLVVVINILRYAYYEQGNTITVIYRVTSHKLLKYVNIKKSTNNK